MILPLTLSTHDTQNFGVTKCNWQLFEGDLVDPDAAVRKIKSLGVEVVSLHSPFSAGWDAPLIENFCKDPLQSRILVTAEYIASALGKNLPIVFHTRLPYRDMYYVREIACKLTKVLEYCPHLTLLLENCAFYHELECDLKEIPKQVPLIVKEFNRHMPLTRVYSCFDFCHANIVNKVGELLVNEGINTSGVPTVEDFCKEMGKDCRLVHLANCRNYGVAKRDHGTGFGVEDKDLLTTYLNMCTEYLPNAQIVLEISEADYTTRPEACKTLETLSLINF